MSTKRMAGGHYVGGDWRWKDRSGGHGGKEYFAKAWGAFEATRTLAATIEDATRAIRQSKDLTEPGKRKELAKWVESNALPTLKQAKEAISGAREVAASKRAALKPNGSDRSDLVGALIRKDIRDFYAKLDPAARVARIRMGVEPETALALTEAPAELSGITKDQHASLVAQAVLASHPEEAEELADLAEATEAVELVQRAAMKSIAKIAGVPEHELRVMLGESTHSDKIAALLSGLPGGSEAA